MNNENYLSDTSKTIGAMLVVILPVLQFGFTLLPSNVSGLYVSKESFFFTSLITLLTSVFIIFAYRSNPFFQYAPNRTHQLKYNKYLASLRQNPDITQLSTQAIRDEIVLPPFYITTGKIAILCSLIFIVSGLGFIWIGLNYTSEIVSSEISFLQSILYISMFAGAIYVLVHFSYQEYQRKEWKRNREERVQNAINLAIEYNVFDEMPQINFVAQAEQFIGIRQQLIVQVKIGEQKYNIYTNTDGSELYEILKVLSPRAE